MKVQDKIKAAAYQYLELLKNDPEYKDAVKDPLVKRLVIASFIKGAIDFSVIVSSYADKVKSQVHAAVDK